MNNLVSHAFVLAVLSSPVIWIISITLLSRWKHFWTFFCVNAVILFFYLYILITPEFSNFGHDEYGLNRFVHILMAIVVHIVLGGIFALYKRGKMAKAHNTSVK